MLLLPDTPRGMASTPMAVLLVPVVRAPAFLPRNMFSLVASSTMDLVPAM